jgi:hypothetical protein
VDATLDNIVKIQGTITIFTGMGLRLFKCLSHTQTYKHRFLLVIVVSIVLCLFLFALAVMLEGFVTVSIPREWINPSKQVADSRFRFKIQTSPLHAHDRRSLHRSRSLMYQATSQPCPVADRIWPQFFPSPTPPQNAIEKIVVGPAPSRLCLQIDS